MEDIYLKDLDLSELMDRARSAVVGQARGILRDDPGADLQYVVLDLPCSFFALRSLRCGAAPCAVLCCAALHCGVPRCAVLHGMGVLGGIGQLEAVSKWGGAMPAWPGPGAPACACRPPAHRPLHILPPLPSPPPADLPPCPPAPRPAATCRW